MIINEKVPQFKLIVSDIDGTIKNYNKKYIDPNVEKLLNQLMKNGVFFSVATGRPFHLTTKLFQKVSPNTPSIFEGGGTIYDWEGNNVEFAEFTNLEIEAIRNLLQTDTIDCVRFTPFNKPSFHYWGRDENIKTKVTKKYSNQQISRFDLDTDDFLNGCEIERIASLEVYPILGKTLDKELLSPFHYVKNIEKNASTMLTKKGVNKKYSLEKLIKLKKVRPEEIVLIVENNNDIEMTEINAGAIIAVGDNIPKEIKNRATHFVQGAEHVADQLEKIFSNTLNQL